MVNNRQSIPSFIMAVVLALLPFIFLPLPFLLVILARPCIRPGKLARYFIKWIGGYTGDCLGRDPAGDGEIVIYLGFVIVWRVPFEKQSPEWAAPIGTLDILS